MGLLNLLLAIVAGDPNGKPCIADQLPAWATASPAEKKALLDHCRAAAPTPPPLAPPTAEVRVLPVEPPPEPEPPEPPLRVYLFVAPDVVVGLPSAGVANFREWHLGGFVTGTGRRATPAYFSAGLLDLELGLVLRDRFRFTLEGAPPLLFQAFQLMSHFGYDVVHFAHTRQGVFGAITLWLGGGYEHLSFTSSTPQSYGPLVSARVTWEHKWGVFFLRVEAFARLQLATQFDIDNEGEGVSWKFPFPAPIAQLGMKLGLGLSLTP